MAANVDVFPADDTINENRDLYGLLAALSSVPSVAGATCHSLDLLNSESPAVAEELRVMLAHRDHDRDKVLVTQRSIICQNQGHFIGCLCTPVTEDASVISVSPSGQHRIMFRPGTPQMMEIWTPCRKSAHLEVPAEVHGTVFNDGFFGYGFTWSPCGRYVAYCAERGKKKAVPPTDDNTAAEQALELQKPVTRDSKLKEDWGEKHTNKLPPTVFVLDLQERHICEVPGQAKSSSYGQPHWTPEAGLLMVEWPHQQDVFAHLQFRLGLVYCFNRNCRLVFSATPQAATPVGAAGSDAKGKATSGPALAVVSLHPPLQSALEPRVSEDGATLVFTSHEQACKLRTHSAAVSIHKASWEGFAQSAMGQESVQLLHSTVVAPVAAPAEPGGFPGLYSANLSATMFPARPFIGSSCLLVNSLWGSTAAVLAVELSSGNVHRLTPTTGSYSIIATSPLRLYAAGSSLPVLPSVFVLDITSAANSAGSQAFAALTTDGNAWKAAGEILRGLGLPKEAESILADISVTRRMSGANVESVVYRRKSAGSEATPGVLFLHGGPHSAVADSFIAPLAALLSDNVTVVLPNYRGSSGYGEDHLRALPGHIGEMDVQDCHEALQEVIAAGLVDPARVVVQGGSHGGFLTGHMIGQYPDTFKAAVMRNPVLNIPLMVNVSDIPDWCQVETDGSAMAADGAPQFPPSLQQQKAMHEASPIAHIDKVKTPVMMMLGAKDRRVPYIDGMAYAKALRCRGKVVEVHVFEEDAHPLDKPTTSFVSWLRIISFFRMHLK